jgi:DNA-binding PadR family transcriptional regulator
MNKQKAILLTLSHHDELPGVQLGNIMGIGVLGLYTSLRILEHKGYVSSKWGVVKASRLGNRMRLYKITEAGRTALYQAVNRKSWYENWLNKMKSLFKKTAV